MKITITWLSIISFSLNILLAGLGFYQYLQSQKQEDNLRMVVRSWQNQAEGLSNSLTIIAYNPNNFSTKEDMAQAVAVASGYAYYLNNALSQQRFYTDSEVKSQREQSAKTTQDLLNKIRASSDSGKTK